MKSFEKEAELFLSVAHEFKLGKLPTESQNPKTIMLSSLAKDNLEEAIKILKEIDLNVFYELRKKIPEILKLKEHIKNVLDNNGKIFLVGCGATGRLSLALETLWRLKHSDDEHEDRVVSFMAGGDVALIHSVEKFEDFPEFGERQMMELGFSPNDLLIATTEGGETPFVIGATNKASKFSQYSPYFLYCNPDEILKQVATRSREVLENEKIIKLNLSVGQMALTGSTRMQATTILMYAVGLALLNVDEKENIIGLEIDKMISFMEVNKFEFLKQFIERETEIYQKNEFIYYETNGDLGISILTDTTERSPTFSLHSFENQIDEIKVPSLSYLLFPGLSESKSAWFELLKRTPRAFHWPEVTDRTSIDRLIGFDFSNSLILARKNYCPQKHHHFKIYFEKEKNAISFELDDLKKTLILNDLSFLSVHLVLKILLNTHSTLVMGRMNRYESNLMTWVRASNYKLIDRTIRYVQILLEQRNIKSDYKNIAQLCFEYKDEISRDEALVLFLVNKLEQN